VTETKGVQSLKVRLREEADAVALHTARLCHHRRLRNLLIGKARVAGLTVREIESLAGVSNVRVSQIDHEAVSHG
jgi:hypothetical protein